MLTTDTREQARGGHPGEHRKQQLVQDEADDECPEPGPEPGCNDCSNRSRDGRNDGDDRDALEAQVLHQERVRHDPHRDEGDDRRQGPQCGGIGPLRECVRDRRRERDEHQRQADARRGGAEHSVAHRAGIELARDDQRASRARFEQQRRNADDHGPTAIRPKSRGGTRVAKTNSEAYQNP